MRDFELLLYGYKEDKELIAIARNMCVDPVHLAPFFGRPNTMLNELSVAMSKAIEENSWEPAERMAEEKQRAAIEAEREKLQALIADGHKWLPPERLKEFRYPIKYVPGSVMYSTYEHSGSTPFMIAVMAKDDHLGKPSLPTFWLATYNLVILGGKRTNIYKASDAHVVGYIGEWDTRDWVDPRILHLRPWSANLCPIDMRYLITDYVLEDCTPCNHVCRKCAGKRRQRG